MAASVYQDDGLDPKVVKRLATFRADQMVTPCLWKGRRSAVAFSDSELVFASSGPMGTFASGGFLESTVQLTDPTHGTVEIFRASFAVEFSSGSVADAFLKEFEARRLQLQLNQTRMSLNLSEHDVLIRKCEYLGGAYLGIHQGQSTDLLFREDRLAIYRHPVRGDHDALVSIAFSDTLSLNVSGPGKVTSGGGYAGGGIGLLGAAEGMVIAGILNAVTSSTKIVTLITVADREHEGFFVHTQMPPTEMRHLLSPVFVRIRQHHRPATAVAAPEEYLISHLERLSHLHATGALTDPEYAAAKASLLKL